MSSGKNKNTYTISDYNKYLCLKFDSTMWLITLFLIRPYIVLVLSVVNRNDRMGLINLFYEDRVPMVLAAFAAIPAIMVLYSWTRRAPNGSSIVRWIWKNGRALLIVSAILNIVIVFSPIALSIVHKISLHGWLQLFFSVCILLYLVFTGRVVDLFSDFPAPDAKDTGK